MRKTHCGITNKLQLSLHFEFTGREMFLTATCHIKLVIIRGPATSRIFTPELLFPELYKPRIPFIVLRSETQEIVFEPLNFKG